MCLIDTDLEWPSQSPWSSGLRSLTSPWTASSVLGLPCLFQMERLLPKFAGEKHRGSDISQFTNGDLATGSGLRSVMLDMTNPNKRLSYFCDQIVFLQNVFQAMSKLALLFFLFSTKLSLKSLKKPLSLNPHKSGLFNKERDANTASQYLYVFRMQYSLWTSGWVLETFRAQSTFLLRKYWAFLSVQYQALKQ